MDLSTGPSKKTRRIFLTEPLPQQQDRNEQHLPEDLTYDNHFCNILDMTIHVLTELQRESQPITHQRFHDAMWDLISQALIHWQQTQIIYMTPEHIGLNDYAFSDSEYSEESGGSLNHLD